MCQDKKSLKFRIAWNIKERRVFKSNLRPSHKTRTKMYCIEKNVYICNITKTIYITMQNHPPNSTLNACKNVCFYFN